MVTDPKPTKPLGMKAYGSIPHLPGSRMGPADHHCHEGQARIATVKARDRHDTIIVQEKLDGSCVAVAKVDGEIVPLIRAGYRAIASDYFQHILFDGWVRANYERFDALLDNGERVVGEWLAQAHGTRYDLTNREPFVAFDLVYRTNARATHAAFQQRLIDRLPETSLATAPVLTTFGPASIGYIAHYIAYQQPDGTYGFYGAIDPVEGAVWRVERHGIPMYAPEFDFAAKWVRPDKVDGCYLESVSGGEPIWNWRP